MIFYLVPHDDGQGLLYSEEAEYNLFIDDQNVLTWNYKGDPNAVRQGLEYFPLADPVPLKDVIEILESKHEDVTVVTATENENGNYTVNEYYEIKRSTFVDKFNDVEFLADSQDRIDLRNIVNETLSNSLFYKEVK